MMTSDAPVLIMAGGTGGHVFPALAVARELTRRGRRVEWLGTGRGIEAELVPDAGYPLHFIDIGGFRGKGLMTRLGAPLKLLRAIGQAVRLLRRLRPAIVVGFGGYVAGPVGLAAVARRIPLAIHEQNAVAGTTNRWLSRLTRHRLAAFPDALPEAEVVGNPVRDAILEVPRPWSRYQARGPERNVLVVGGSLGALHMNRELPALLAGLSAELHLRVRHQCGPRWLDETVAAYERAGVEADVVPFITDMAAAFAWADLVICRAGAMTVSEIAAVGVAAVFIPLPGAIDDHQAHNARWLVDRKAAWMVRQDEHLATQLGDLLTTILVDRDILLQCAERARELACPDATQRIATRCEEWCHA